jgi:hypothetical protein
MRGCIGRLTARFVPFHSPLIPFPTNVEPHAAVDRRQGTIFDRVGRQFMKDECERRCRTIIDIGIFAVDHNPGSTTIMIGMEQLLEQAMKACVPVSSLRLRVARTYEIMRSPQSENAIAQIRQRFNEFRTAAGG